jgi:hypothetical protein
MLPVFPFQMDSWVAAFAKKISDLSNRVASSLSRLADRNLNSCFHLALATEAKAMAEGVEEMNWDAGMDRFAPLPMKGESRPSQDRVGCLSPWRMEALLPNSDDGPLASPLLERMMIEAEVQWSWDSLSTPLEKGPGSATQTCPFQERRVVPPEAMKAERGENCPHGAVMERWKESRSAKGLFPAGVLHPPSPTGALLPAAQSRSRPD